MEKNSAVRKHPRELHQTCHLCSARVQIGHHQHEDSASHHAHSRCRGRNRVLRLRPLAPAPRHEALCPAAAASSTEPWWSFPDQ